MSDVEGPERAPESSPGTGPTEASPTSREAPPEAPAQSTRDPVPYDVFQRAQTERTQFKRDLEAAQQELEVFNSLRGDPDFQRWAIGGSLLPGEEPAAPAPPPKPSEEPENPDDWLKQITEPITSKLDERLKPIEDFIKGQRRERLEGVIEKALGRLESDTRYPHFDRARDWPHMLQALRTGRARSVEDAYRVVFYDRQAPAENPAPPPHEVGGRSAQPAADKVVAELKKALQNPELDDSDRERIAAELAMRKLPGMGATGVD